MSFKEVEVIETISYTYKIKVPDSCLEDDQTHEEYLEDAINFVGSSNILQDGEKTEHEVYIEGEAML